VTRAARTRRKRKQAVQILEFMGEKGVLMALKAETGPSQELARQAFFELMNPKASTESLPDAKDGEDVRRRFERRHAEVMRRAGMVAASLVVAACGPSLANSPGSNLLAKNVVTSDGIVVTPACTPTGPELCFNANDDNCNGVIDEGCGVGTGVLQFMVAWGDSPADIDISVTDPNGSKVHKSNRTTSSGLLLEKNCPEEGCHARTWRTCSSRATSPREAATSSR
jgi:hypothetical protein